MNVTLDRSGWWSLTIGRIPSDQRTSVQIPFDSQYAKAVLSGLGRSRVNLRGEREFVHHVYAGTVPYVEKQARRARNKVARASRRMNRS